MRKGDKLQQLQRKYCNVIKIAKILTNDQLIYTPCSTPDPTLFIDIHEQKMGC